MAKIFQLKNRKGSPVLAKDIIYNKLNGGGVDISLETEMNVAKRQWLIDIFNTYAGEDGRYNTDTDCFELYDIKDIKDAEAMAMVSWYSKCQDGVLYPYKFQGTNSRALFSIKLGASTGAAIQSADRFMGGVTVEVIKFEKGKGQPKGFYLAFSSSKLRRILGELDMTSFVDSSSFWLPNLVECYFANIKSNISFDTEPKIEHNSFRFMVDKAANTAEIIITVHPNVYAALTGEAEYPFNGGTSEQWRQLMSDATARQIVFASA